MRDRRGRSAVAGVVLAGGASERMGRPKATLRIDGETFVARIARHLAAAGCAPLIVVAGRHARETFAALDEIAAAAGPALVVGADRTPAAPRLIPLVNPDPERGQLSSLRMALEWLLASEPGVRAALVALVDHPAVRASTYAALLDAAIDASSRDIILPTAAGRRGHPVLFARTVWAELLALPDDAGARAVVRADPGRVFEIPVDDPGIHRDVDTPADLAGLTADAAAD